MDRYFLRFCFAAEMLALMRFRCRYLSHRSAETRDSGTAQAVVSCRTALLGPARVSGMFFFSAEAMYRKPVTGRSLRDTERDWGGQKEGSFDVIRMSLKATGIYLATLIEVFQNAVCS